MIKKVRGVDVFSDTWIAGESRLVGDRKTDYTYVLGTTAKCVDKRLGILIGELEVAGWKEVYRYGTLVHMEKVDE